MACTTPDEGATPGIGQIEGQVFFTGGAVANAPVRLRPLEAGAPGDPIAETVTDGSGHYEFEGHFAAGDYALEVPLAGVAWTDPESGRSGSYDTASILWAPVLGFELIDHRTASISPFTTLAYAAGRARIAGGASTGMETALIGMSTHLTLDAVSTSLLPETGGALIDPVAHALLVDSFTALAARISYRAGIEPGTDITAARLLTALIDDAEGPSVPGVFDGHGAGGRSKLTAGLGYELDGQTLRADLAASLLALVEDEDGPWSGFTPSVTAQLRAALTCSATPLFPDCEVQSLDMTPPVFGEPTPPVGEALSGHVTVLVRVSDPESGVRDLTVTPAGASEPLVLTQQDGLDVWQYSFDSTRFSGDVLVLECTASSEGGTATQTLRYPLANVGTGTLAGQVPGARDVRIVAHGVHRGGLEPLGETVADEGGAFTLEISEWDGAVLVTASGLEGAESAYWDRARGEWVSWRLTDEMSTLLPHFDPLDANNPRLIVTALGHMAYSRARYLSESGGAGLLDEYAETVALLADHFGLSAEAQPLWRLSPRIHSESLRRPFDDPDRLAFAEACLHQQALRVARLIYPQTVYEFTARDLAAAWAVDVGADGYLDGRTDLTTQVFRGADDLQTDLLDGFRGDLSTACAEWLVGDVSQPDLSTRDFVEVLSEMAVRVSALFDVEQFSMPEPFDMAGPELDYTLEALTEGRRLVPKGEGSAIAGALGISVSAQDAVAGVASVEVVLLTPEGAAVAWEDALTMQGAAEPGQLLPQRGWHAEFATTAIPDGQYTLSVTATDTIGNANTVELPLQIDNTPPGIELVPADPVRVVENVWRTRAEQLELALQITDDSTYTPHVMLGQQLLASVDAISAPLPANQETVLSVEVTDAVGNVASVAQTVVSDTLPPSISLVPQTMLDETRYFAERRGDEVGIFLPAPVPSVTLERGSHITKLQTTWENNLPTVVLAVADAGPTADAPEDLQVELQINNQPFQTQPGAQHSIELSADQLRIDPIDAPPPAGFVVQITGTVTDRAGNVTSLAPIRMTLDVMPPPILIEYVHDSILPLSFDNASIAQLVGLDADESMFIAQVAFTNPSALDVWVRPQPSVLSLSLRSERQLAHLVDYTTSYPGDRLRVSGCLGEWNLENELGGPLPNVANMNVVATEVETNVVGEGREVEGVVCEQLTRVPQSEHERELRLLSENGRHEATFRLPASASTAYGLAVLGQDPDTVPASFRNSDGLDNEPYVASLHGDYVYLWLPNDRPLLSPHLVFADRRDVATEFSADLQSWTTTISPVCEGPLCGQAAQRAQQTDQILVELTRD